MVTCSVTEVALLHKLTDQFGVCVTTVMAMIEWLWVDMILNNRRMNAWYHYRGEIEAQARFEVQCATQTIIRAAIHDMDGSAVELDKYMGDIILDLDVPLLKNNEAFEAFEEQEPLTVRGSLRVIFVPEQIDLQTLVTQDSLNDLPTVLLQSVVPNGGD